MRTKFYMSMRRAEKLKEEGDTERYGKDTEIIGCEMDHNIGVLVKGQDIKNVIFSFNEEEA